MQRALMAGVAGCFLSAMAGRAQEVTPQSSLNSSEAKFASEAGETLPRAPLPQPQGRLTLGERFKLEARVSFGLSAVIAPAAEAGYDMAHHPSHYPREWTDGGGAYGRNYGAELARHTAGGLTRFATAAVDREDPRYYPSTSRRKVRRIAHAVWFTVWDKSDTGHGTFALSNFTGAAAAGYSGMPYEPEGFNDFTHATQRAGVEIATYAGHNVVTEFSPEIYRMLRAMHVPLRLAHVFISENPGVKP